MEVMLDNGVIPIVNENDTVSVTELMFTDNDELSGLIASMLDADELIILSNIDGIYNGSPKDPRSEIIPIVTPDRNLSDYIQQEKSGFGRGGMTAKCNIARLIADEGIKVIIANGKRDDILIRLINNAPDTPHTEFTPNPNATVSTMKKWIAHSGSFTKGSIHINRKATEALCGDRAVSLLPVGVTAIEGDFEEGDIVSIISDNGEPIGIGRSGYSSDEARKCIGQHDQKPIVHYDYLVINP